MKTLIEVLLSHNERTGLTQKYNNTLDIIKRLGKILDLE